jgi:hypothetical protein
MPTSDIDVDLRTLEDDSEARARATSSDRSGQAPAEAGKTEL